MKVSFVSLFAFAGIFAGALAAPAAGAAPVDTAAIEKRDVISDATAVVRAGLADVREITDAIIDQVAAVKNKTLDRSQAVNTIQTVLIPDLSKHIGEITNSVGATIGAKLMARQAGDGLDTFAGIVAELVAAVFDALNAVQSIVSLTTGTLAGVIRTLAATLNTLLSTVIGLNAQLSSILTGLVGGTLASLNNILGGLLNGLADLLPGLLPGIL